MNNYAPSSSVSITVDRGKILGASLLVAGTCIGGGMLALPVDTAACGLIPSIFAMLISWAFMTFTGLLFVEASLWMPQGGHVMTMAANLLGKKGKLLTSLLYLFMGYSSLVGYVSGGSELIRDLIFEYTGVHLSKLQGVVLFSSVFGYLIFLGTKALSRVNSLLVMGMIIAFILLLSLGFSEVKIDHFSRVKWAKGLFSLPLILTSFSYQMVVPSLTSYLNRSPSALKKAVILGTTCPFIAYITWQIFVLGCVTFEGEGGLAAAFEKGQAVTTPLIAIVTSSWIGVFVKYFSFFAIITSYLGIGLGLFDFLQDLLKVKELKNTFHYFKVRAWIMLVLIAAPTAFFALYWQRAFLMSLEISGGFGDTLLNGLIPVSMVWIGRYVRKIEGPFTAIGGKKSLILALAFAFFVLLLQCIKLF